MKYKLKALSLSAVIALVVLLSACDYALSPPAEPTPNLQPTIDALVDQRLAEKEKEAEIAAASERESAILNVALVPTFATTPVPTSTPTAAWLLAFPLEDGAKIERCAGEDPFLKVAPSLVEINALTYEGDFVSGSGFIVDGERGFILTATHVVSDVDPESLTVTYRDGIIDSAIWVAREPSTDISLLYAPPLGFPALRVPSDIREALAESRGGDIAERIRYLVAIGVVDDTYLTDIGETLALTVDNAGWPNLTVDTPIVPGMSGGPLVDQCGKLVGILSLGDDSTATAIGLNQSRLAALMRDATSFLQATPTPPTPAPTSTSVAPPKQWTHYQNGRYGYAIDVAPGWTTGQLDYGGVSLDAPDGEAQLTVFMLDRPGYTLEAFADETLEFRRSESKAFFEELVRGEDIINGLRAIGIGYKSQTSEDYCIEKVIEVLLLNGSQGYELLASACQEGDHYAKDMLAMLESFKITNQKAPTPTPKPSSSERNHVSWIERGINQTGLPPLIPDWLRPYVTGPADPYTLSAIAAGEFPGQFDQGGIRQLPTLVWSGQELVYISSQTWCGFSPTQRLMVVEFVLWLGGNFDRQPGIWEVWNRCPPATSY